MTLPVNATRLISTLAVVETLTAADCTATASHIRACGQSVTPAFADYLIDALADRDLVAVTWTNRAKSPYRVAMTAAGNAEIVRLEHAGALEILRAARTRADAWVRAQRPDRDSARTPKAAGNATG
ncbi:MAG: hypothetical protein ACRDUW_10875 [Pseudonocardiaceae bacterium]